MSPSSKSSRDGFLPRLNEETGVPDTTPYLHIVMGFVLLTLKLGNQDVKEYHYLTKIDRHKQKFKKSCNQTNAILSSNVHICTETLATSYPCVVAVGQTRAVKMRAVKK